MKIARIYGYLWILVAMAGGVLWLTNSFTTASSLVLGFVASTLAGAALLVVFPAMMSEQLSPAAARSE